MDTASTVRSGVDTDDVYLQPDERRANGKALRDTVPRDSHGLWKAPKNHRDPVDILNSSNVGRQPDLIPIRFGRMMQSPFAFYRGSAAVMAADSSDPNVMIVAAISPATSGELKPQKKATCELRS